MRMQPLGTVLSQLLLGGKGQYNCNRFMDFAQSTINLCHVTLDCVLLSSTVKQWGNSFHFIAAA